MTNFKRGEFDSFIHIKNYQRLKIVENRRISLEWNVNRVISKISRRIRADTIKDNLIPQLISKQQQVFT